MLSGVMFFHTDSTEDTYDIFHERLAGYLRIENWHYDYDYIFVTDRESALKQSQMKNFPNSLHNLCTKHLTDNLIMNCNYKKNSALRIF